MGDELNWDGRDGRGNSTRHASVAIRKSGCRRIDQVDSFVQWLDLIETSKRTTLYFIPYHHSSSPFLPWEKLG